MSSPFSKILATGLIALVALEALTATIPHAYALTTIVIQPSLADTYLNEARPNRNYGASAILAIRALGNQSQRALVTFSLASIPQGLIILSATISVYVLRVPSTPRTLGAHRVTANWTELGATWGNQPAFAATPTSVNTTGATRNVWLSWKVTDDVAAGYSTPSIWNGFMIMDEQEWNGSSSSQALGYSRNIGNPLYGPKLTVTYALQIPEVPIWFGLVLAFAGVVLLSRIRTPRSNGPYAGSMLNTGSGRNR